MKSILLATGENRSLSNINRGAPSPMLPLLNRPVMMYSVELLYQHGLRDILVNLYDSGDQIESYFGDGMRWGVDFSYILQREAVGSAGSLRRSEYHLDSTFVVIPADIIINFDIEDAIAFHRALGGIGTAILQPIGDRSDKKHTPLTLTPQGTVASIGTSSDIVSSISSYGDAAQSDDLYLNTGVYIFESSVLDFIPKDQAFDIEADLMPELLKANESIAGYVHGGYWNRLSSYSQYADAQLQLLNRLCRGGANSSNEIPFTNSTAAELDDGVWLGKSSQIHPRAIVTPPVMIGEGAQLLADCEIGPNVVIGDYAVVDESTVVSNSSILHHTYVGKSLDFDSTILTAKGIANVSTDDYSVVRNKHVVSSTDPNRLSRVIGDIILRATGIALAVLLLPLTLLLMLAVSITTAGPALAHNNRQRLGERSNNDSENDGASDSMALLRIQTRRATGELTSLGGWLEKYELHRLPELWNVALGDLRLVGTEPLVREEAILLNEEWEQRRNKCRAGFTGHWYTQANLNSTLVQRTTVDAYYAVTRTLWVDFRELFFTPLSWFKRVQQRRLHASTKPRFDNRDKSSQVALGSD